MKTISLQQLRATLRRHLYDERSSMTVDRGQPVHTAPINSTRTDRLKTALRHIPILAPVLTGAYQLVKMPSRIALLLLRLESLFELIGTVSRQNKFATSRMETLEKIVLETRKDIQVLRERFDRTGDRPGGVQKQSDDPPEELLPKTDLAKSLSGALGRLDTAGMGSFNGTRVNSECVKFIGVDAAGAEPMALRGMQELIDNNPDILVFIEFAPEYLASAKLDPQAYLAEIRRQGFKILEVNQRTGQLTAPTDEQLCSRSSVNLMLRKSNAP